MYSRLTNCAQTWTAWKDKPTRETLVGNNGASINQRDDHIDDLVRQLKELRTNQADFDYRKKVKDDDVKQLSDSVSKYADEYIGVGSRFAQAGE